MKDIIVLCDGSRVDDLATALRLQCEGEGKGGVLRSGRMHRYGLGVIVLECEQEQTDFLHALESESAIFDYSEGPEDAIYYVVGARGAIPLRSMCSPYVSKNDDTANNAATTGPLSQ